MILVTITKQKDGEFDVNHWEKLPKHRPTKTHGATTKEGPGPAQIEQFRVFPPEILRLK